jgi:hypothetical protein
MRTLRNYQSWFIRAAAVVAVVFGIATIRAGGSVLFGDGAQAAGHVVGFVLWFNLLAGFAYVAAGAGLWLQRYWSAQLALAIAAATVLVFAALGIHVATGGAFEMRTVWAMTLRSVVWILLAILAFKSIPRDDSAAAPRRAAAIDKPGIVAGSK